MMGVCDIGLNYLNKQPQRSFSRYTFLEVYAWAMIAFFWRSALVDIHAQASQIRAGPLGRSLAIVHVGLMVFKPNKILEFNHFPHCSSAEWTVIVGGELPEKSSSAGKVIRQDAPGAWPPCPPSRSRQPPLRIANSDSQQRTTCGVCPGGPNVFAN